MKQMYVIYLTYIAIYFYFIQENVGKDGAHGERSPHYSKGFRGLTQRETVNTDTEDRQRKQ